MRKPVVLIAGMLLFAAIPPAAALLDDPFLITLFTRVLIFALAAVSLDLIVGYGAMVSLGHAAFFGLGAYVVGILSHHAAEGTALVTWPVVIAGSNAALVTLPAAALATALFALVVGAVCLRTSGVYFIMITLAFAQMAYFFFITLRAYGGEDGLLLWGRNALPGIDLADDGQFYYLCLVLLLGFTFVCRRLVDSSFGQVIRGCKANEPRMRALGFAVYPYKLLAFAIAGAGAGLAGGLLANANEFVSPASMSWVQSGEILVMVILGGMGTLYGPILGALAFLLLEDRLSVLTEHWMLALGPILILVVLFLRRGLYPALAGPEAQDG